MTQARREDSAREQAERAERIRAAARADKELRQMLIASKRDEEAGRFGSVEEIKRSLDD